MASQGANQLFQVLYLGRTGVDRHCSLAVMPWIAEELKLKTEQRILTWLTPGETGVSYVADSGAELFHHTYSVILRCATGTDSITFSYIIREEEGDHYTCHVFQCLTPADAEQLTKKFRTSAKGESVATPSPADLPPPTSHTVHHVTSVNVHSSTHSSDLLDSLLDRLPRRRRKLSRKGILPKLMRGQEQQEDSTAAVSNDRAADGAAVHIPGGGEGEKGRSADLGDSCTETTPSETTPHETTPPVTGRPGHMVREDSCDVSIKLTRATPERMFQDDDEIEGREEGEGGTEVAEEREEVDSGEVEIGKSPTLLPERVGAFIYNSDNDDDSHTTGSSTSCTTPDPTGLLGDLTPTNGITPAHSNPKLFQDHPPMFPFHLHDDRPASCPPLERGENATGGERGREQGGEGYSSDQRESRDRPSVPVVSNLISEERAPSEEMGDMSLEWSKQQTGATEETDAGFDTLPELSRLRDTPQFKALAGRGSGEGGRGRGGEAVVVRLVISPNVVQVVSADGSKVILRRTIRSIACCTQGERRSEFVGFVCREGQSEKTFICHIFRAASQAMATAVMDSFKSSFVQALNSSPTAMCDSCPLRQLHLLCQNIDGVPTPVAQSRIQECLDQLSEVDYNCIMSEYKSSEHADHEFTQLVVLVSLIREHLQKKQQEHIHPIANSDAADTLQTKNHQPVKPVRMSPLERAKLALTSSFDNLRKGSAGKTTEKRHRQFGKSLTTEDATATVPLLATEDRRASLDPKLLAEKRGRSKLALERSWSARVPPEGGGGGESSGGEEVGGGKAVGGRRRTGSWLQRFRSSRTAAVSSQDEESDGEAVHQQQKAMDDTEEREPSPIASSSPREGKEIKPAQKLEMFESKEELPVPPPTSPPPPKEKSDHPPSPSPPSTLPLAKFRTPTHVPAWRKSEVKVRRAHTRASFSLPPNDGTSQAYSKYRREHKRSESMSWRHEIFESVTPVKERRSTEKYSFQDWEIIEPASFDQLSCSSPTKVRVGTLPGRRHGGGEGEGGGEGRESPRRVSTRVRWRRAIEQQIMLQRMEKENQSLLKASSEADIKRLKLCYQDPSINVDNVSRKWAELLSRPHPPDQEELITNIMEGVTPARRGEVWSLLIQQYRERHPSHLHPPPLSSSHSLSQLRLISTDFENAILMDLGRTFPSHPYFRLVGKGGGQRGLANILHGYAVSDEETGYCQGLSFIAGMILMHTKDEESAYELLCQMMFVYNYRDVYSRDLSVLQIRLYQLSRLLHDVLPTLHSHLGMHEITPFYYAAPWFLTLFSSQFPIAFVARVMDLFFLDGPDIVFKVSVALLRYYETHILRCTTMESISEFLKEGMPQLVLNHMTTILEDAQRMDLETKLQNFETEYFVLEELTTSFSVESDPPDLKSLNESFRSHSKELIEQLAYCRGVISNLDSMVAALQETVSEQQRRIGRLEASQSLSAALSPDTKNPPPPPQPATDPTGGDANSSVPPAASPLPPPAASPLPPPAASPLPPPAANPLPPPAASPSPEVGVGEEVSPEDHEASLQTNSDPPSTTSNGTVS